MCLPNSCNVFFHRRDREVTPFSYSICPAERKKQGSRGISAALRGFELLCDAAGTDVAACIAAGKAADHNAGGGVLCVDELAAADVHANVGSGRTVAEEDEVAGAEVVIGNGIAVAKLCRCGAVDAVAELAVDVLHKAGAVKAGGRSAAVDVRITDERHAVIRDLRAK